MRKLAVLIALASALAGCGGPFADDATPATFVLSPATTALPAPTPVVDDELGAARAKWAAAGLDSYQYEFLDDCGECDQQPPGEIVVWDGDVLDPSRRAPSVEDAFALIDSSLAAGRPVEVTYHPELGYPTDLWIDRESRAFDGGTHWVLADVTEGLPGNEATVSDLQAARLVWERSGLLGYEFRTSFLCDCEVEGTVWTRVEDGLVTDWSEVFARDTATTVSPITITQLFDDLAELVGGDEFVDSGISVTGSALYDPDYGYPVWIGLDIEVLDPDAPGAALGPKLVFVISDFNPIATDDAASELNAARSRWANAGLTTYNFQLTSHDVDAATFSDPYFVTVRDGQVADITQNGEPSELGEEVTVEGAFEMIDRLKAAGVPLEVLYHAELGHPVLLLFTAPDGSSTRILDLGSGGQLTSTLRSGYPFTSRPVAARNSDVAVVLGSRILGRAG